MRGPAVPVALVALVLLPGCADEACDPAEEDCSGEGGGATHEGGVELELLSPGCSGDLRWVDAVLVGTAATASLELVAFAEDNSVAWAERHGLPIAAADEAGWWEDRYVELDVAAQRGCDDRADCAERYANGTSTLFACDAADLTATVRVTDAVDRSIKRCVTWGARTDLVEDCTPWTIE